MKNFEELIVVVGQIWHSCKTESLNPSLVIQPFTPCYKTRVRFIHLTLCRLCFQVKPFWHRLWQGVWMSPFPSVTVPPWPRQAMWVRILSRSLPSCFKMPTIQWRRHSKVSSLRDVVYISQHKYDLTKDPDWNAVFRVILVVL